MAEKRAYDSLVTAMDRKARELNEYLVKADSQGRTAKSKHDKLMNDVPELTRLGEVYVATLSVNDDKVVIDEVYEKQSELLEKVHQALEAAVEFVEDEDYKLGIMKRTQEVEQNCKSVETRLEHFKKKTDRFKTDQYVLPKDSYDVLINELEDFVKAIDDCVEKIGYLILNDPDQKVQHEEKQNNENGFKSTLLDMRLTLIGALEKQPSDSDRKDSATSSLPNFTGLLLPP